MGQHTMAFDDRFRIAPDFTLNLSKGGASISARTSPLARTGHARRSGRREPGLATRRARATVGGEHHYVAGIVGLILIYAVIRASLFGE